jgi:hypothetical protein
MVQPVQGFLTGITLPQVDFTLLQVRPDGRFITVHSFRPPAGEGLGVRVVDSKTYLLTLALSPMNGEEGTEWLRRFI